MTNSTFEWTCLYISVCNTLRMCSVKKTRDETIDAYH